MQIVVYLQMESCKKFCWMFLSKNSQKEKTKSKEYRSVLIKVTFKILQKRNRELFWTECYIVFIETYDNKVFSLWF